MNKLLATLVVLSTACASVPTAGGHESVACDKATDPRAPGYTIYVCPRPFTSHHFHDCPPLRADQIGPTFGGGGVPCGWTAGFTDKKAKEIFVYDVEMPEVLEHELLHVQGSIRDDQ